MPDPVDAPADPAILLLPDTGRLTPLPPTKLSARLPFPAPSNLAAADLTPPELGIDGGAEAWVYLGDGLAVRVVKNTEGKQQTSFCSTEMGFPRAVTVCSFQYELGEDENSFWVHALPKRRRSCTASYEMQKESKVDDMFAAVKRAVRDE
ncbi:hypothetical protein GW17_00000721 [Ensete ventricosum]|nr:hypothetical protein GW17_00000721 [Ensete ventricosum]